MTQAGFVKCQEFAKQCRKGANPIQPVVHQKLSTSNGYTGPSAAVDYGKQWTILRSTGLVQCLVNGRPETLFDLSDVLSVKVNNPREMREGVDYFVEVDSAESRFILKAESATDHFDWVLAIEQNLRGQRRESILRDHRKRESGYIAFKRLLMSQTSNGSSQLYCLPRAFDDMEDIYDPPRSNPPPVPREPKRSELLQPSHSVEESTVNAVPLPPRDDHPPPLPPRDANGPPLPPRIAPLSSSIPTSSRPISVASSVGSECDDYVVMHSPSGSHTPTSRLGRSLGRSPSQPITIPNRRPSKRSVLLRGDSESSSHASSPPSTPLGMSLNDLQLDSSFHGRPRQFSTSSTHSLQRQNSNHSLSSSSYTNFPIVQPPPTPPRTMEERSSGYCSPLLDMSPSPNRQRTQSASQRTLVPFPPNNPGCYPDSSHSHPRLAGETTSRSDGMIVSEAKQFGRMMGGGLQFRASVDSNGYASSESSSEDLSQVCTCEQSDPLLCTCTCIRSETCVQCVCND